IFTNALNIALAFLFVFGFGWGVPGVAAATLISEYARLALGGGHVQRTLRALPDEGKRARLLDRAKLVRMVSINSDIVLRTLCVVSVLGFFMAKSAELGDVTLAANQVLHHFLVFTSFALDGVAHAAEARLGYACARRASENFRRSIRIVFVWAGTVGLLAVLVYAAAGHGV